MRIGFIANEILGASKNGGIGTATAHVALFAARDGHQVDVIYTGSSPISYRHQWTLRLQRAGVRLTHLEWRGAEIYPVWLRESSVVYDYLRTMTFDFIIFQDWEGVGYASVVAKHSGLAFAETRLVLWAHGPTSWLVEANRRPVRHENTLGQLQLERLAIGLADLLLSPSQHMLDWLERSGEPLPERRRVVPLYLWSDPESDIAGERRAPIAEVRTIVFFGRLEERKGIDLFVEAILSETLASAEFRVVFLGKAATRSPDYVRALVEARRPALLGRLTFETDLDTEEAQRYLAENDCLAVIPSLIDNAPCVIAECLRRKIPFLSTRTGGIPELVAEEDQDRVLVKPDAARIAARIAALIGQPFPPATPAYTEFEVANLWRDLFVGEEQALGQGRSLLAAPALGPTDADIAVIVTHYERPALVTQTLESLAVQTISNFEVVLVDDGSNSLAASAALKEFEGRSWPFRFKIVRQDNRYLGAARNAGIRATEAARLIFMDDDNLAFPTLVEVLERAQRMAGVDIVTSQMTIFRDPNEMPDFELLDRGERWAFTGGSTELGLSINCYGDATGIYRREVFERIGYFHEWRGIGCEDWHLHVRAALAGFKSLSLPVPLFWYRRVPGTMLNVTDRYVNNAIIWDVYRSALPSTLLRLVDLSIRNNLAE